MNKGRSLRSFLKNLPAFLIFNGGALLLLSPPCAAQVEAEVLEEVRVTARKQDVDIQDAPVAISTVSGEDFERANLVKLDNFNGYVPGLVISKNDGAGRVVSIRGVGWETAQNLSTQPSVLVYLDGVYLANPLALGLELGEIERIEVLRGPQGTEFGQGTTGGAINIITKKPDFSEAGGTLGFQTGSHGLRRERASVNLVIGAELAIQASIENYLRDGFAEVRGGALDGYDLDDADALHGQMALHWLPHERVSLRLAGVWQDSDQHGAAQKHIADPNPNSRELTQDYPSGFALYNHNFSAILDWETPWGFRLKSLTGLQKLEKRQTVDGDRLSAQLTSVNLTGFGPANFDLLPYWDNDSDAFSQEINLSRQGDRLDWMVGVYYLDHENFNDFLEAVGPAPVSQFDDQLSNPSPQTLPPFVPPLEFVETRRLTREDGAVYGQLTWRLNDTWALTLGGRFQQDKSTDLTTQFWFIDSEQVLEDEAFTWKAGIDIHFAENHLLYGLISTGWKNGGNNPGALNGGALDVPVNFAPEEVTAYEIGSKNLLFDKRLRLNATAFYYDYQQFQFIQEDPIPFSGGTGNIPQMRIYGLESEFSWLMSEAWRLDGSFSVMDGKIESDLLTLDVVDFLNSGFGRFTATGVTDRAGLRVNLNGNEPPKLVDLSSRLMLNHHRVFHDGSKLISRLDWIYRGEYQYRVFNNPSVDRVPSYATMSLFFGYQLAGLPLEISLSATNLFDEDGVNSRFTNPFGLHTTSEEFIPPREILARLRYTF